MQTWETDLLTELERLGEEEVRAKQLRTEFGSIDSPRYQVVDNWLCSKRDARSEVRAKEALSISREANLLSRDALSTSRRANTIAIIAMILSVIATISAAVIGLFMKKT